MNDNGQISKEHVSEARSEKMEKIYTDEECTMFNENSKCADLILLVENKKIYVNRNLLMIGSPFFNAMLSSDFKEKDAPEIPLPGKKYYDIVAFLQCLYPDHMDLIDSTNVYEVLPLADEYQCSRLKQRCQDYLMIHLSSEDQSIENAIKCTVAAEKYCLDGLLNECLEVLSDKKISHLEHEWEEISDEGKVKISKKRIEKLEAFCDSAETQVRKVCKGFKQSETFPIFYRTKLSEEDKLVNIFQDYKKKIFNQI